MNTDFVTFSEAPQANKRFYIAAETNVTSCPWFLTRESQCWIDNRCKFWDLFATAVVLEQPEELARSFFLQYMPFLVFKIDRSLLVSEPSGHSIMSLQKSHDTVAQHFFFWLKWIFPQSLQNLSKQTPRMQHIQTSGGRDTRTMLLLPKGDATTKLDVKSSNRH